MRKDHRPYWLKRRYLDFCRWYTNHFLRPACDHLGDYHNFMKPWYIHINGPNINIGQCATIIGEPDAHTRIGVWGREPDTGSITIGDYAMISPGTRISASDDIRIGHSVMMGHGTYITDCDWHDIYDRTARSEAFTPVIIGDNVWLGDHCAILKGVTIGDNSVVAARAVVTRDVPDNVVVAGNPGRIVKTLDVNREDRRTRANFFADPEAIERFYDDVDRMVLTHNDFWRWLRVWLRPERQD